jgi:hypothetical protein
MSLSQRDAELIAAALAGRLERERRERLRRWGAWMLGIVTVASLAVGLVALAHAYGVI